MKQGTSQEHPRILFDHPTWSSFLGTSRVVFHFFLWTRRVVFHFFGLLLNYQHLGWMVFPFFSPSSNSFRVPAPQRLTLAVVYPFLRGRHITPLSFLLLLLSLLFFFRRNGQPTPNRQSTVDHQGYSCLSLAMDGVELVVVPSSSNECGYFEAYQSQTQTKCTLKPLRARGDSDSH